MAAGDISGAFFERGDIMTVMRLENMKTVEDIELWGVRGLRVMVENFHDRIINGNFPPEIDVMMNDVHLKALDVEKNLKRVIKGDKTGQAS